MTHDCRWVRQVLFWDSTELPKMTPDTSRLIGQCASPLDSRPLINYVVHRSAPLTSSIAELYTRLIKMYPKDTPNCVISELVWQHKGGTEGVWTISPNCCTATESKCPQKHLCAGEQRKQFEPRLRLSIVSPSGLRIRARWSNTLTIDLYYCDKLGPKRDEWWIRDFDGILTESHQLSSGVSPAELDDR